jgi:hypothetical protein
MFKFILILFCVFFSLTFSCSIDVYITTTGIVIHGECKGNTYIDENDGSIKWTNFSCILQPQITQFLKITNIISTDCNFQSGCGFSFLRCCKPDIFLKNLLPSSHHFKALKIKMHRT